MSQPTFDSNSEPGPEMPEIDGVQAVAMATRSAPDGTRRVWYGLSDGSTRCYDAPYPDGNAAQWDG